MRQETLRPYTATDFFLWPPQWELSHPLGAGEPLSEENVARFILTECTSLEVESDLPEGSMDGADTLRPTTRVLLGWVGGVLWPLPSVAPRPTTSYKGIAPILRGGGEPYPSPNVLTFVL